MDGDVLAGVDSDCDDFFDPAQQPSAPSLHAREYSSPATFKAAAFEPQYSSPPSFKAAAFEPRPTSVSKKLRDERVVISKPENGAALGLQLLQHPASGEVLVGNVSAGPAAGKIPPGAVVTSIEGWATPTLDAAADRLRQLPAGSIELRLRPVRTVRLTKPTAGMKLGLTFDYDPKSGIYITALYDGPARQSGLLAEGDLLQAVNGHEIGNVDLVHAILLACTGTVELTLRGWDPRLGPTSTKEPLSLLRPASSLGRWRSNNTATAKQL